jgi:arsenite methyltransferase
MIENKEEIRDLIRRNYGSVAQKSSQGGGCACGCSCSGDSLDISEVSQQIGYTEEDLSKVPSEANMGLGCGNPIAIAALKEGEVVLDLGSGGGFDCFLARGKVGETGHVIGVDMTPDMIKLARKNAEKSGYTNVEFRLGEIEHLPVADSSVDVIISNCVINLSLDKEKVFKEAFRVLRPGGRISASDVVATAQLPQEIKQDLELISCCIGGAEYVEDIRDMLQNAGFKDIRLAPKDNSKDIVKSWALDKNIEDFVASYVIEATKDEDKGENSNSKIIEGGMYMKTLKIEWNHLEVSGETCDRCYDTGENLTQEVKRLKRALQPAGVEIELIETILDDTQIPQSNIILFNGVPIEEILNIKVSNNYCDSCTNLLGTETYCRTVTYEGDEYEDIPAKAIRQAALKVLGMEAAKSSKENSGCGCGSSGCC